MICKMTLDILGIVKDYPNYKPSTKEETEYILNQILKKNKIITIDGLDTNEDTKKIVIHLNKPFKIIQDFYNICYDINKYFIGYAINYYYIKTKYSARYEYEKIFHKDFNDYYMLITR